MNNVKILVDLNAHIENITCDIVNQNDNAYAIISFDNLGYGNITAIKFYARGFNSFGDIVLVNGQDNFFLIVQDIEIEKNKHVMNLKAKLPNSDIKKLELQECQICYADGEVITYAGEDNYIFEMEEFDNMEETAAIKKIYGNMARYKIKEFEQGWICTCGRHNLGEASKCSLCGNSKEQLFYMCSTDGMNMIVERYHNIMEQEKKNKEEEKRKQEQNRRKRHLVIFTGIIGLIIVIALISNVVKMSKRQTYSSEKEMQEAMQGNWSHRNEYDYGIMWQLQIEGDKCTIVYDSSEDTFEFDITWNPSKGTFDIGTTTYIVESGGQTIKENNYLYEKGGMTLTPGESDKFHEYNENSSYESIYSALKFSEIYVTNNSSYTVCTGKVTNYGNNTYSFVTIKGAFEDSSGTVVDTASTYAIGSEGLSPGESKSFRMSVKKDLSIEDCSITISDYDY